MRPRSNILPLIASDPIIESLYRHSSSMLHTRAYIFIPLLTGMQHLIIGCKRRKPLKKDASMHVCYVCV